MLFLPVTQLEDLGLEEDTDPLLQALGRRKLIYAEDGLTDITNCPPHGWNYFGSSKSEAPLESDNLEFPSSNEKSVPSDTFDSMASKHTQATAMERDTPSDLSTAHRPTSLEISTRPQSSLISNDVDTKSNKPHSETETNDNPMFSSCRISLNSATVGGGQEAGEENEATQRNADRPSRPAPRTATLVKVRVEKRPVSSHSRSERFVSHSFSDQGREHLPLDPKYHRAPSVEEEVAGLMAEVKAATKQIKQEVKQIRQSDTPTPDTPTPLKEFREFLNKEEEQELERLPTITELQRENEEESSNCVVAGELNQFSFNAMQPPWRNLSTNAPLEQQLKISNYACSVHAVASVDSSTCCKMNLHPAKDSSFNSVEVAPLGSNTVLPPKQSDNADWKKAKIMLHKKLTSEKAVTTLSVSPLHKICSTQTSTFFCPGDYELLDNIISNVEHMVSFLQYNVHSGNDFSCLLHQILKRIELFENEIRHLPFHSNVLRNVI